MLCLKKGKRWAKRHANCWSPLRLPQPSTPCPSPNESFQAIKKRNLILQHHLAAPEGTCGLFSTLSEAEEEEAAWALSGATMAPSPPPTGLLHQNSSTSVLGALPSRLVTEDTPPDMLAGSMDLRVTLPNGHTLKMSVERSTPMMDLLVHITTAHKVSPGGHVLQAMGERGVLPYKPSTPIGALDTWSIRVVPRHQVINTPQQQQHQQGLGINKRAPPKPLALQPTQPFEQTFRLQVRLPRNQLYVSRISPRTSLAEILAQVCRDKNLDPSKYELRHPVNTEQSLQLSLTLADYRVTEVALVVRGSRAATELSSSDLPALQSRSDEPTSGDVRTQRASNSGSTASTGSATGIFGAMLKRSRSGGTTEGSLSGDSLGGRSSSPARSDESLSRSISPPASRPPGQTTSQMQPPPPPRHRKGRAPKPPPQAAVCGNHVNNKDGASGDQVEDRTLVISHSRNSSDSSGYHEASVLSESPENHVRHPDSPSNTLNREKKSGSKAAKSQAKQFSRSMTNLPSEASTSHIKQPPLQKLSNTHSMSTTSLAAKKKRAPAPPPPRIPETQPSPVDHPERDESAVVTLPNSSSVLEKARPNPAPRTRTNLAPAPPKSTEHKYEIKNEPPPVKPRATKAKSSSELYKKSSSIKGLVKKSGKRNKSVDSMTGSLKRDKKQSSIGSSSSSVFGVGKSLLSLGSSQDVASDSDVDDLDLAMFESGNYGENDSTRDDQTDEMTVEEEAAAFENFHSALRSKKRNSITQIINKSKPPTPKAQRPIGYRVRPKLENIHWSTMDESNINGNDSDVSSINKHSLGVSSSIEDDTENVQGMLRRWSNTKTLHETNQDILSSGDGSDSDKESTEERSLMTNGHNYADEDDSLGEEELDSAFQSVTDVLEEQIRTEAAASAISNEQAKIVQEDNAVAKVEEKNRLSKVEEEEAKLAQAEEEARLIKEEEKARLEEETRLQQEQQYRIALEEQIRHEEVLKAEAERREAEYERKRIDEERARLAEEREELARQRREQQELEKQLRERLEQELKEKQQALQEEQRREIERLQKEQEELERELREKEKEKADRLRVIQPPQQAPVIEEIVDWEYKLPAPPSAFRDHQVDVETSDNNLEALDLERRNSSGSSSSEQNKVETKNKLNAMMETEDYIDDDVEIRPKPPEVVELRVKKSVSSETQQRSLSPPCVSVVPLRSAHSLYSLVHMEDDAINKVKTESVQPMRKTSSVADVSSTSDDEARLQHLQQQFVQWQQQLITNQSVLQGHVSMPLQSLQVLREILPQMKQKLSEESNESSAETIIRSSTLPRTQRTAEIPAEPAPSVAATLDRRPATNVTPVQRYRPPTVNLGTWSERPKSEVSIKQDSDYRIGVGQHQYTAARAPVVRSTEPKLKDTTNLIAGGAINREVVARSNSWRAAPIQSSVNKSSMVIIQNMNSANATEQVRASNKPTVILRHQPMSLTDMQPQRRYTTLIGVNGAPQPAAKSNGYQNKQRNSTSITQATNPVVKGFKLTMNQTSTPAPPPPPPVIRNITQKRAVSSMPTNDGPDTRDRLMDAIRGFGGRSNLRKIGSPNNLIYQS